VEYDEGTFIMQARAVAQGQTPFIDFSTISRRCSCICWRVRQAVRASVFRVPTAVAGQHGAERLSALLPRRPFTGAWPALIAQAVFLFSPRRSTRSTP